MASSSKRTAEVRSSLHMNLVLLEKLIGASAQMKEYLKPGVFTKPNRIAFEHTMHFLIKAYNLQLCQSTFTYWPIVERRTQERLFKRDVVAVYSKIAALEKDFPLLPLSPSFLSSPGGERLESFLFRLSSLALRCALQRRQGGVVSNPPRGLDPQRCLKLAKSRTHAAMKAFIKQAQHFLVFMRYCADTAQNLREELVSNLRSIRHTQASLADLRLESTPLEDIFSEDIVNELHERSETLLDALQVIQRQEEVVENCGGAVRMLLDNERPTVVLESEELLDIAALLNRAAGVVKSLCTRFASMTTPEMLRELPGFVEELSSISDLMEKNLKATVELTVTASSSVQTSEPNVDTPEKLRHVCQMLEDANHATPPLEFRPATMNPTWQTISADTESPPISCVTDLLGAKKSGTVNTLNGTTRSLSIRKPASVVQPSPKVSGKFGCTPARPRSEIPLKVASRNSRSILPNPKENASKVVASGLLPKAAPSEASMSGSARSVKVLNGKDVFDIPSKSDLNKDDSAQDVLDLAVAVLCPGPSRNISLKEELPLKDSIGIDVPKPDKKFDRRNFSESMSEAPVVEEGVPVPSIDSEKSATAKKIKEKRQSILDLIQRYKDIVPVSENTEAAVNVEDVVEPEEWNDSNHDFSFGSDEENFPETDDIQSKFQLSPGF